jgi:succinyl-CoA synthetase beta subunit
MNFEEYAAKPLLAAAGIATPQGQIANTPLEAAAIAEKLGNVVIKAQVPTGKRGKAGGIKVATSSEEARTATAEIIGMEIATHRVESVLVEECADIAREFYAAVLTDREHRSPLILFSTLGGMDIEEAAEQDSDAVRQLNVDIRTGLNITAAKEMLTGLDLGDAADGVAETLVKLYQAYKTNDAELIEINPLVLKIDGELIALDCKFVMDDSALSRHATLAEQGTPDTLTELELRGQEDSLKYIELSGSVGVLANGAGLTMTTMDVIQHCGGTPANFLEIGGEAYTKGTAALELVLANPNAKSLVINFCGAFARCDVMVEGIINAWENVRPTLPVFFSVHGTGEDEAVAMLKDRLSIVPYPTMEEACAKAVEAAQ